MDYLINSALDNLTTCKDKVLRLTGNVKVYRIKNICRSVRFHDNRINGLRFVSSVKTDGKTGRRSVFKRGPTGLQNRAVTRERGMDS
jgi:hypothetical protein